jgi:ribosomal protein S18 acetylase RimI-like enzyme
MTVLAPMGPQAFAAYVEAAVAGYAQDNIDAGRWPAEGALARSQADFASLLPQGLATPDHHLFEILAHAGGPVVGVLWLALEARHGLRGAFVYDIEIHEPHRRQGHATRTFRALEALAVEMGASSVGLHVFAHNPGAQALYARLGYAVSGINMLKPLEPPALETPA